MKELRQTFSEAMQSALAQGLQAVLKHLKFLDEMGAHLGLTRLYGRAAPGQRVVEATPGHSGPHYTVVALLGHGGVEAPWVLDGAMDRIAFETYVEHVLAPTLHTGDIVVLDNLSSHTGPRVRALIEARGARLQFLPPYSPDFNPIELCWSKVKTVLRTAKARTLDELLSALATALDSVSRRDIRAWFAHCGYSLS